MNATTLQTHIDERTVTILPVRLTNEAIEAIEAKFVQLLSPQFTHFQFFGGARELSPQAVEAFCTVHGRHHSMAFIATLQENGEETQIGVSRFAPNNQYDIREMVVTVADLQQHQELGMLLAEKLIAFAKDHGVKNLYSVELADNWAMRDLARDLGMTAQHDTGGVSQVIYSLSL